jgi:hypothetical protein
VQKKEEDIELPESIFVYFRHLSCLPEERVTQRMAPR